jgi:hypothetical protein
VLCELFMDEGIGDSNHIVQAVAPKVAADSTGLHLIYHVKNATTHGFDVCYKKSKDKGITWSKPEIVLESNSHRRFYEADVASTNSGKLAVYGTALVPCEMGGRSFEWRLFSRLSSDGGISWSEVEDRGSLGVFASSPCTASDGKDNVAAVVGIDPRDMAPRLHYFSKDSAHLAYKIDEDNRTILNPSLGICGNFARGVWQSIGKQAPHRFWGIDYFVLKNPSGFNETKIIRSSSASIFHYDPEILCAGGTGRCQLVWSTLDSSIPEQALWGIKYVESSNCGDAWSKEQLLSPAEVGAWNPRVCQLSDGETLIVWEQHGGGDVDLYGVRKSGHRWGSATPLTPVDGINSVEPDSAAYQGVGYIAWQELIGNEWVVRAKAVE